MNLQFAETLVQLREQKDFSPERLASALCINEQTISRWESGDVLPQTAQLIALCRLYKMRVDQIIKMVADNGEQYPCLYDNSWTYEQRLQIYSEDYPSLFESVEPELFQLTVHVLDILYKQGVIGSVIIQRNLSLGFLRTQRILDSLVAHNVVASQDNGKYVLLR